MDEVHAALDVVAVKLEWLAVKLEWLAVRLDLHPTKKTSLKKSLNIGKILATEVHVPRKEVLMAALEFDKMARVLVRCEELALAPDAKAMVKLTYAGVLEERAHAFMDASRAVMKIESLSAKETREANVALERLDQPYREARSVVKAFVPTAKVPMTLKQLTTDTDRLQAIGGLLDVLKEYESTPWAGELMSGKFGQTATSTMNELAEAIAASRALADARKTRAEALEPAYEAYVRFKRVVRDAAGSKSHEYRRIHLRSSSGGDPEHAPASAPG